MTLCTFFVKDFFFYAKRFHALNRMSTALFESNAELEISSEVERWGRCMDVVVPETLVAAELYARYASTAVRSQVMEGCC